MARTSFDDSIKNISKRSTVGELIEALQDLDKFNLRLDDYPEFKEILEKVLGVLSDDPKEIEKDLEEIINDLEKIPEEVKEESIEEIEKEVVTEDESEELIHKEEEKVESKLSQPQIDALVKEYLEADEKRKAEITSILEKEKYDVKKEVERAIKTQQEFAEKELNNPPPTPPLTSRGDDKSEIEKFADDMAKHGGEGNPENEKFIKDIVMKAANGEEIPNNTARGHEIELRTKEFLKQHSDELEKERIAKIEEAFNMAEANAPTEAEKILVREYGQLVKDFYSTQTKTPSMEPYKKEAQDKLESEGIGVGKSENAFYDVKAVVQAAYTKPKDLKDIIDKAKGFSFNKSLLPNIPEVRSFQEIVSVFDKNENIMFGLQNMVHTKIKMVEWASKLPVVGKSISGLTEKIGGVAIKGFLEGSMKVMAEQGMLTGAKAILQGIAVGSTATAEAGGSTALVATIGAIGNIPVLGWVVMAIAAAVFAFNNIIKPLYDKFNDFLKRAGLNTGVRNFFANTLNFGDKIGGIAEFGFNAMFVGGVMILNGMAMLFGPLLTMGLMGMTAMIAPVIIGLTSAFFVFQFFHVAPMIGSLVPPPQATGGTCVPKETPTPGSSGKINCNLNAPENNTGIDKANFVRLANQWRTTGKNYASECFNDVVNKALCAGVNPQYALWAWLHESGASNYDIPNVEDFGIHGQASAPPKNFTAQINYFLKLDPGTKCTALGYWLSFATNYLTGECDPKKGIPQSDGTVMTGEKYLLELQEQWNWIKTSNLPSSIKVSKGGQNCLGASASVSPDNEYVAPDGTVMICSGPVDSQGNFIGNPGNGTPPNFEPWDPNIPVPAGCPSGLPTSGSFTQGPFANNCTHQSMSVPAVDFGAGNGTAIVATHPGVASLNYDSIYGYYIDVHGKCDGKDFYTRYAHMPANGFKVGNNSTVKAGQQIGVVDDTGVSSNPHLHYHISGLDKNKFGQYLKLSVEQTKQLWGCCGSWNGKNCP